MNETETLSVTLNFSSSELLKDKYFMYSSDGYYTAPCVTMKFMDNLERILNNSRYHISPRFPFTALAFFFVLSCFLISHFNATYWIEKSRYSRLHKFWDWFDRQTWQEYLRGIPVRDWFHRPHWYSYRTFTEDRTQVKELYPCEQGPGYMFNGWPAIAYISKKKLTKLKRISTALAVVVSLMLCITATQQLLIVRHTYVTGVMADAYIEYKRWNFSDVDNAEFCRRKEPINSVTGQILLKKLMSTAFRQMSVAYPGNITMFLLLATIFGTVASFRYSYLVTFAPSLKHWRKFVREYDYQLREGRIKDHEYEYPDDIIEDVKELKEELDGDIADFDNCESPTKYTMFMDILEKKLKQRILDNIMSSSTYEKQVYLLRHMLMLREQFFDADLFQSTDNMKDEHREKCDQRNNVELQKFELVKDSWNADHNEIMQDLRDCLADMKKEQEESPDKDFEKEVKVLETEIKVLDDDFENFKNEAEETVRAKIDRNFKRANAAKFGPYKFPFCFDLPKDEEISVPLVHFIMYRWNFIYPGIVAIIIALYTLWDFASLRKVFLILL